MKGFQVQGIDNPWLALLPSLPQFRLGTLKTALLVVDMQYSMAHPDHGMLKGAVRRGLPEEAYRYYRQRLELIVPNIRRLVEAFRARDMEVVYTACESLTPDSRERSLPWKLCGFEAKPGCFDTRILDELAPLESELVLRKTASGVFTSTNLDYVLRNLGITQVVVTGVFTNYCVEIAVRNAADIGYEVILVEDGCGTISEQIHMASINTLQGFYANIRATGEILRELAGLKRHAPDS